MERAGDHRMPLIAVYLFLVVGATGFLQPFVPLYLKATGLSLGQIGWILGVSSGLALLVQPLLGQLSDRLDARRPLIVGCALLAASAFLGFPYVRGYWPMFGAVALGTNCLGYLNGVAGVLVGRMVRSERSGTSFAKVRVWGSIGYILIGMIAGLVLVGREPDRAALDLVFRAGPWLFVLVAILAFFLPDRRSESIGRPVAQVREPLPANLKWFLLAHFLYTFALYGASSYLSLFVKELGGTGAWLTGTFAAGVVVEVLVMRWSGRFSDRFGRRPALVIAFVLLPVRLALYAPATGPLWILAVQSLHGLNFGIVGAVAVAFANDLASDRTRGQAQGRLGAVAGLAMAVSPILFGYLAGRVGLRGMFLTAAGIGLVGAAVLLLRVQESHPTSESVSDHGPGWLRPALRWLDAPGG